MRPLPAPLIAIKFKCQGWPESSEISGRNQPEWVACFARNRGPEYIGIGGRLPSDLFDGITGIGTLNSHPTQKGEQRGKRSDAFWGRLDLSC
jgi:hypothetical protein